MKAIFISILGILPLFTGCATTGAANPTSLAELKSNTAYVGPDGTVLVKGFAGRYTANFVCVLPTGSYRITVNASREGKGSLGYEGFKAEASGKGTTETEATVIYRPQDRMLAVQQVLGNACVMLGNGIFGDTCTKVEGDGNRWCSGAAPPTTLDKYNEFVKSSIGHLLILGSKTEVDTEHPAGANSSTGTRETTPEKIGTGETTPRK